MIRFNNPINRLPNCPSIDDLRIQYNINTNPGILTILPGSHIVTFRKNDKPIYSGENLHNIHSQNIASLKGIRNFTYTYNSTAFDSFNFVNIISMWKKIQLLDFRSEWDEYEKKVSDVIKIEIYIVLPNKNWAEDLNPIKSLGAEPYTIQVANSHNVYLSFHWITFDEFMKYAVDEKIESGRRFFRIFIFYGACFKSITWNFHKAVLNQRKVYFNLDQGHANTRQVLERSNNYHIQALNLLNYPKLLGKEIVHKNYMYPCMIEGKEVSKKKLRKKTWEKYPLLDPQIFRESIIKDPFTYFYKAKDKNKGFNNPYYLYYDKDMQDCKYYPDMSLFKFNKSIYNQNLYGDDFDRFIWYYHYYSGLYADHIYNSEKAGLGVTDAFKLQSKFECSNKDSSEYLEHLGIDVKQFMKVIDSRLVI
jgi:hypothetical protein